LKNPNSKLDRTHTRKEARQAFAATDALRALRRLLI